MKDIYAIVTDNGASEVLSGWLDIELHSVITLSSGAASQTKIILYSRYLHQPNIGLFIIIYFIKQAQFRFSTTINAANSAEQRKN